MKKLLSILILLSLLVGLGGCQTANREMVSQEGFFFDTIIGISVDSKDGETLLRECFSLCAKYEEIFSRTDSNSELYALNHRTESDVEVSPELAELIQEGLTYGQYDSRFDITVAPVIDLWDFKSEDPQVPSQESIDQALTYVDQSKVSVNGNVIHFEDPHTMIDLGAIVKGWAADQLKEYLVSQGVTSGIINLGGNVLTIGEKEKGTPWTVGIQKPFNDRNETITTVESSGTSVVSSGTYERYFEKDGKLYFHIIDATTGYPVDTDLSQVTIISESSLEGDLLSTLSLIKGAEEVPDFLENFPEVSYIRVDTEGNLLDEIQ